MLNRTLAMTLVLASSACSKQDNSPSIAAPSDTTSKPTATSLPTGTTPTPSATAVSAFPPLQDACTTAADCAIAHRDSGCCFVCGGMYGNKKWVADVESYCSGPGVNPKCPPVNACERETTGPALGYAMASPKCTAGHCTDK